jgi:hypothetical protein
MKDPHSIMAGAVSVLTMAADRACYREGTQVTERLWRRNVTDNTLWTVVKVEPLRRLWEFAQGCTQSRDRAK